MSTIQTLFGQPLPFFSPEAPAHFWGGPAHGQQHLVPVDAREWQVRSLPSHPQWMDHPEDHPIVFIETKFTMYIRIDDSNFADQELLALIPIPTLGNVLRHLASRPLHCPRCEWLISDPR